MDGLLRIYNECYCTSWFFFAYLTLHQVGVNIFRTLTLWNWVQLLLIAITIFDIIFFRFVPGVKDGQSWLFYVGLLIVLIFWSHSYSCSKSKINREKNMYSFLLFSS
ncbi:KinB-signaling pathway activation protein [Lysinibacillus sp. MHQ-1]|nr:KinB-signaling pathway activation protein [Lysinibacillus sp. MHQ-1]